MRTDLQQQELGSSLVIPQLQVVGEHRHVIIYAEVIILGTCTGQLQQVAGISEYLLVSKVDTTSL